MPELTPDLLRRAIEWREDRDRVSQLEAEGVAPADDWQASDDLAAELLDQLLADNAPTVIAIERSFDARMTQRWVIEQPAGGFPEFAVFDEDEITADFNEVLMQQGVSDSSLDLCAPLGDWDLSLRVVDTDDQDRLLWLRTHTKL